MIRAHSPKDIAECLGGAVPIKGGALEWGNAYFDFPEAFCSLSGMKMCLLWEHKRYYPANNHHMCTHIRALFFISLCSCSQQILTVKRFPNDPVYLIDYDGCGDVEQLDKRMDCVPQASNFMLDTVVLTFQCKAEKLQEGIITNPYLLRVRFLTARIPAWL